MDVDKMLHLVKIEALDVEVFPRVAALQPKLTPEAYLELEAESPLKHEYIDGVIDAMAGTSDARNTIAIHHSSAG